VDPGSVTSTVRAAHADTVESLVHQLGSDVARGLDEAEAVKRLESAGRNALSDSQGVNPLLLLAEQFKSPLVALLLAAAVIAGLLGEWVDAVAIATIVILNSVIGFVQEFRAERSIAALMKMTAPLARVLRSGTPSMIPATEVVPGDMLLLEAGDCIAADARLVQGFNLLAQEAPLTGESESRDKDAAAILEPAIPLGERINLVFMGTTVSAGTGKALVTATGMRTEIGQIAGMLKDSRRENTPLQKQIADFGRWVIGVCLGLVALVVALGVLRGLPLLELFLTSVSLAVAAVPEGLPAVVTISMALGVRRMAQKNALIRTMPSVETLGSTEVICTDKTGTLTHGEMSVRELYAGGELFQLDGGLEPEGTVSRQGGNPSEEQTRGLQTLAAVHTGCNSADLSRRDGKWSVVGDPTEGALLASSRTIGLPAEFSAEAPVLHEFPFDSERKRRGMFRPLTTGKVRLFVNGAPDILLGLCTREQTSQGIVDLGEERRHEILEANAAMAEKALRVIGSAYRDFEGDFEGDFERGPLADRDAAEGRLVFAGLAGLQDPPRAEAALAISRCKAAGIRVVMITGDHPRTALAIARELGLAEGDDQVISGPELDLMEDAALSGRVLQAVVYARVTAAHKLRIVAAWRAHDKVVAMTGDGVNDAPALKGADIGIAMGITGTEVTKQAADMVLADDNFSSIVAAIEEGRGVYYNIRKTLQYLLAGNAGELLVMILALAWGWPAPLLAVHLLWINLVTDGLPALVLASGRLDGSMMRHKPRPPGESLVNRPFIFGLLGTGFLTAGVSLFAFWIGLRSGGLELARSHAFDTLVFSEVLRALAYRSDEHPFWRLSFRSVAPLLLIVAFTIALQTACHEVPLMANALRLVPWNPASFALVLSLAFVPLIVLEGKKLVRLKRAS
jgi:Ca2+-transporting ATPase